MGTTNKDTRTVRVEHPDGRKHTVTPEVAQVLVNTEGYEIVSRSRARTAAADPTPQPDPGTDQADQASKEA